jgi:hypothetical protein
MGVGLLADWRTRVLAGCDRRDPPKSHYQERSRGFGPTHDLPQPVVRGMLRFAEGDEGLGSVIRVDLTRTFPVPAGKAFAFITDTANWNAFFPNFIRLRDPLHAKWNAPGDMVTVVIRILGRAVDVNMTLEVIETGKRVVYRSRQSGLPDARHERRFTALPDGFEFGLGVAFDPRNGLRGLYDRFLVKPAVAGALRETVDNLDRVFGGKPFCD